MCPASSGAGIGARGWWMPAPTHSPRLPQARIRARPRAIYLQFFVISMYAASALPLTSLLPLMCNLPPYSLLFVATSFVVTVLITWVSMPWLLRLRPPAAPTATAMPTAARESCQAPPNLPTCTSRKNYMYIQEKLHVHLGKTTCTCR